MFGFGEFKFFVKGVIKGNLKNGNGKRSMYEIYVVENFKELLLGWLDIDVFNLV